MRVITVITINDDQQPAHDEGQERQGEDVEAHVLVELRVARRERDAVAEQEVVLPLAHCARRGDGAHDDRDDRADHGGVRGDPLLIATDQLVLGPQRQLARTAKRSTMARLTHDAAKNTAAKTKNSSSFTSSVRRQTWGKWTDPNHR